MLRVLTSSRAFGLALTLGLMPLGAWAGETTLRYKETNQWVAPEDNAALRPLYAAAKKGTTRFNVVLPKGTPKTLSEKRLEVLLGLMEKHSSAPLTVIEANGKTAPNTLKLSW